MRYTSSLKRRKLFLAAPQTGQRQSSGRSILILIFRPDGILGKAKVQKV